MAGDGSTMQKYEKRPQTFLKKSFEAKCCSFEERCSGMSRSLETAKQESVERERKYELRSSKLKPEEDQSTSKTALHESRTAAVKARLAAAREKFNIAAREGAENKRKSDQIALEKGATIQEQSSKQTQLRKDSLRAEVQIMELRLEEMEKEIEPLLKSKNEQRAGMHVLEELLAQANNMVEALFVQLQATQNKFDQAHQQLIAMRLNETALDGKFRTGLKWKRVTTEDYDMGVAYGH